MHSCILVSFTGERTLVFATVRSITSPKYVGKTDSYLHCCTDVQSTNCESRGSKEKTNEALLIATDTQAWSLESYMKEVRRKCYSCTAVCTKKYATSVLYVGATLFREATWYEYEAGVTSERKNTWDGCSIGISEFWALEGWQSVVYITERTQYWVCAAIVRVCSITQREDQVLSGTTIVVIGVIWTSTRLRNMISRVARENKKVANGLRTLISYQVLGILIHIGASYVC